MCPTTPNKLEHEVEERLALMEPEVEVLLCELVSGAKVRLFIEHPEGVSLELCERVTRHLRELLESYSLEVSSPGPERPLTKPGHFRRYVGRRVRVRTLTEHGGRRNFTGELIAADERGVTVGADDSVVAIGYDDIRRSNLLPETGGAGAASRERAGGGATENKNRIDN